MNKILVSSGIAVLLIICILTGCAAAPVSNQVPLPISGDGAVPALSTNGAAEMANVLNAADSLINIQASGEFKAKPDVAYIELGVETQNKDAKAAQDQNKTKIDAVITALKAADIVEKDIETLYYNINPQYDYSSSTQKITGYLVSNTLKVTCNDVEKVGEKIDAAMKAGANNVNSVYFGLKDITVAQNSAIKEAMKNAGSNAKSICDAAGVKLGDIVHIQYGSYNSQPYYYAEDLASGRAVMESQAAADEKSTYIQSGDISVQVSINISYKFAK